MSVSAVSYGRDQVFASIGSVPVVFPLPHFADYVPCSSVHQINCHKLWEEVFCSYSGGLLTLLLPLYDS